MKPSIPKGTRDFSPTEMVRRNFILDTIKTVYQRYGFQQIETPVMENLSTLEGKYGEEGDKLLYRVLNSGPVIEDIKSKSGDIKMGDIAEKGMRYDLTVPFARYVVMHQNEITFPFKRYQIQPVWRADRPQKGRYREFVQCDADVIGSTSLLNEVELIQIIDEVFKKLGLTVLIKFNNRKILNGIVEVAGIPLDRINDILNAIDESDKIGIEKALGKLIEKNFSSEQIKNLQDVIYPLIFFTDRTKTRLEILKETFKNKSEIGLKGLQEANDVINELKDLYGEKNLIYIEGLQEKTESQTWDSGFDPNRVLRFNMDFSLARGLNYYTGAILEVKVFKNTSFTSSVLGGGRYDDLTGIFGLPNVSGVGISFGVDRIYDVMEEMKLFDALNLQSASTQVMFVNFGKEEEKYCLQLIKKVRDAGINAEIYPEAAKMKKQMGYADDKKIPFVVLAGSEEIQSGILSVKNMQTGEQEKISIDVLIGKLK